MDRQTCANAASDENTTRAPSSVESILQQNRPSSRPPRILLASPIVAHKLYCIDEWARAIAAQQTDLLFDVLLIDNTDQPHPGYLRWLREWCESRPFGPRHRVRLLRFGREADGMGFRQPIYKVQYAEKLAWDKFQAWKSYDHLWFVESDVIVPPHGLQTLYDSGKDWAAAWCVSRRMLDPRAGEVVHQPLIFHSLTQERWASAREWDDIRGTGYLEKPGEEPFAATVTHLGCTLIRGEVVRSVPFRMATAGGDCQMSWRAAQAGYQPWCIPAVDCEHRADWEG